MRKLGIIIIAILLQACGAVAKTPAEFREVVKQGRGMTKYTSIVVDQEFNYVLNQLNKNTAKCFNRVSTRSTLQGPIMSSTTTMHTSRLYKTGKNTAELTIQEKLNNAIRRQGEPEHGNYMLLTDIEEINGQKTRITTYGMSFAWDSVFAAINSWSNGENVKCPF